MEVERLITQILFFVSADWICILNQASMFTH